LVGPVVSTVLVKDLTSILANLGSGEFWLVSDAWNKRQGVLDELVIAGLHAGGWKVIASSRREGGKLGVLLYTMNHWVRKVVVEDIDSVSEGLQELVPDFGLVLYK
jgi:hypothetical protein